MSQIVTIARDIYLCVAVLGQARNYSNKESTRDVELFCTRLWVAKKFDISCWRYCCYSFLARDLYLCAAVQAIYI